MVIDVGSTSVRASTVQPDGSISLHKQLVTPPQRPSPGLVEMDGGALAQAVLDVATRALADAGPVDGVAVTNQRGSTVVWDASTGEPIGPALSWQDLRTVGTCLELQAEGLRLAPNESATKVAWLMDNYDKDRRLDLRFGTLDTWVVWKLTQGRAHVTDLSNAAITGLLPTEGALTGSAPLAWDSSRLARLGIDPSCLPSIVSSSEVVAEASALPGAPPICALLGDQQASLLGQGAVRPGDAKATFGTGAFLDVNIGPEPPSVGATGKSGAQGCLPIIAWSRQGQVTWGVEALMLTAGSSVDWLVDDLGLLASAAESCEVAARCDDTDDVWFVPAFIGLGTPHWDFGARPVLIGMTAGTGRPQLVRALLRGVAHRGADLLEAADADASCQVERLRVDGALSGNTVFVQELADACQRPVEVSAQLEATSLGAGFMGGLALGYWEGLDEVASAVQPRAVVEPAGQCRRERWRQAVARSQRWVPELSELSF